MNYQTINDAILGEYVNNRQELVDKLSARFAAHSEMLDSEIVELANRFRSEKLSLYTETFTYNDPIDW